MIDHKLYSVKAITLKNSEIIEGYISFQGSKTEIKKHDENIYYEINSYSICRNTGIKIDDEHLFENDLCCIGKELYFVDWDESQRKYKLRSSINYHSRRDISSDIKIIGNIALNNSDYDKMQKYSNDLDEKYNGIISDSECRSKQHLNKQAKMFLPR